MLYKSPELNSIEKSNGNILKFTTPEMFQLQPAALKDNTVFGKPLKQTFTYPLRIEGGQGSVSSLLKSTHS